MVAWLQAEAAAAGAGGAVFGLSGGIDSAVVAGLCSRAFPGAALGLIMPCGSDAQDARDARAVAEAFAIDWREVPLDEPAGALLRVLPAAQMDRPEGRLAVSNLKPRLRMMTLYYHANLLGYLVVGTGNLSELTVGYFTKHGDGGVDLLPLGKLVKHEVRALARYLGVPEAVIARPPSAGLWAGQTDEGEMGINYTDLDHYIRTGEASPAVAARVGQLQAKSTHKRRLPPVFDPTDQG